MAAADRAETREQEGKVQIQATYMVYTYFRMIIEQVTNYAKEWFSTKILGREPKTVSLAEATEAGATSAQQELASVLIRAAENVKQQVIAERNKLANSAGNSTSGAASTSGATAAEDDGTEIITKKEMDSRMRKGLADEVMDKFEETVQKEYTQDGLQSILAGTGAEDVAKQVVARMRDFLRDSLGAKRGRKTATLAGADASSDDEEDEGVA